MIRIILGFLFLFLSACSHTLAMPIVATDESVSRPIREANPQAPRVKGEDCGRVVFIFPIGIASDKQAFNKTLQKAEGANALIDVTYKTSAIIVPPLYQQICIEVEGTAVKL